MEKNRLIERGPGIVSGLKDVPKYLNIQTVSGTILALGFALPGMLRMASICAGAGLGRVEMVSWLFSIWFFGGLIGVVMSLRYKMPIAGAYSIPGSMLLVSVFETYDFHQAVTGYFIAGIIVLIIGVTGSMGRLLRVMPMPIVSAMIVGMLFKYATGIITGITGTPTVAIPVVLVFLLTMRFGRKFPPIIAALIVGVIMLIVTKQFSNVEIFPLWCRSCLHPDSMTLAGLFFPSRYRWLFWSWARKIRRPSAY